jgi:hypothetical protein
MPVLAIGHQNQVSFKFKPTTVDGKPAVHIRFYKVN